MLSKVSLHYFHQTIKKAHASYQNPLIWDTQLKHFVLDESRRYHFFSKVILAFDIYDATMGLILGIVNYTAGLDFTYTLVLLSLSAMFFHNICLDINLARRGKEYLQLANALLVIANRKEGRPFFGNITAFH